MTYQQLRKCIDAFEAACTNRKTCEGCTFNQVCEDLDTSLESVMFRVGENVKSHVELVEHLKMAKHLVDTYQ